MSPADPPPPLAQPPLTPAERLAHMQAWLDFWKFFLGSVAVTLVSTGVSWVLKERELGLQRLRENSVIQIEDTKSVGAYLTSALSADIQQRIRFARYFARLTRDAETRGRWGDYLKELDLEREQAQVATAQSDVAEAARLRGGTVATAAPPDPDHVKRLVRAYQNQALVDSVQPLASSTARSVAPTPPPRAPDAFSLVVPGLPSRSGSRVVALAGDAAGIQLLQGVAQDLADAGFQMLGNKVLHDDTRPPHPEVRYFFPSDAAPARALAQRVGERLRLADPVPTSYHEDASLTQPGYFEVWLPPSPPAPPAP